MSRCPDGQNWRYVEGSCYLPVHARQAQYSNIIEARSNCQKFSADLASFPSYQIEQAVYDKLIEDNALVSNRCMNGVVLYRVSNVGFV